MQPKYKRILLKLSGEALAAGKTEGVINEEFVGKVLVSLYKNHAGNNHKNAHQEHRQHASAV